MLEWIMSCTTNSLIRRQVASPLCIKFRIEKILVVTETRSCSRKVVEGYIYEPHEYLRIVFCYTD